MQKCNALIFNFLQKTIFAFFCEKGRKSRVLMVYFGQKVAFFPCRILKRAILYRDSPLFYEFLVLSLGGWILI